MIYIFWACRDAAEAKRIIRSLLEKRLIACASILPIESLYRWEGKVEESLEVKVLLKTQPYHFSAIQTHIETNCSYEVPEIVQVEISKVNPRYLNWVIEETSL